MPAKRTNIVWEGETHAVPVRDNQKQRAYDSERAAFREGGEWLHPIGDRSLKDVEAFVRKVEASSLWAQLREAHGDRLINLPREMEVKPGRGAVHARGGHHGVTLPRWARTVPIILHEMAHVVIPRAGHNWPWAAVYLRLVGRFMGAELRDRLKAEFKKRRVKFTPPRKFSAEHMEKLRAQGFKLAAAKAAASSPDSRNETKS